RALLLLLSTYWYLLEFHFDSQATFLGLPSAENHCLNLSGICRRDICKLTEDQIGICKRRWRCCRAWWILIPIPTPLVYSDYQAPPKHRLK
uniref:Beta-defensin-like domain-containing protein n=1 Tax=Neovison vison TaxID=452646 RepID=A0A8C7ANG5_NEOVI